MTEYYLPTGYGTSEFVEKKSPIHRRGLANLHGGRSTAEGGRGEEEIPRRPAQLLVLFAPGRNGAIFR